MSFTVVTCTYQIVNPSNSASSNADDDISMVGYVSFTPQQVMINGSQVSDLETKVAYADSNGNISIPLLANDDPSTYPTIGNCYLVQEVFGNVKAPSWYLVVPHTSSTLNLASVNRLTQKPS